MTPELLEFLKALFTEICQKWRSELVEFGGEADHVHLLLSCVPDLELSSLINNLKTVSSRLLRKHYANHFAKYYYSKPVVWSKTYCLLTTGGATIETIKKYIENQGNHN